MLQERILAQLRESGESFQFTKVSTAIHKGRGDNVLEALIDILIEDEQKRIKMEDDLK